MARNCVTATMSVATVWSSVVGTSPFGLRLWRLLAHRTRMSGMSLERNRAVLARRAEVPGAELAAVIDDGAAPDPDLVRRLAPALGIHTADLFVVAGLAVPDDLASAWRTSPVSVDAIVRDAIRMNTRQRSQLSELISSMPVQPRTAPAPVDDYPDIPAALLVRLMHNRNMRPFSARLLCEVGGGPYVSDSTVGMLGRGKVAITPLYVTAFAHLLGYAPGDMVALTGVGPVVQDAQAHSASSEIAALAWRARYLTSEQLSALTAAAHGMLHR